MQLCNGFDRVFNLTTFSTRGSRWRKVPAIGWFVCSTGDSATSSHRITDIWFGETVGSLCVFIIISLISLFLSLSLSFLEVCAYTLTPPASSLFSREVFRTCFLKKRKENTWQRVHTLFSSAYSDPFRFIWDLNCKVNQQEKKIGCKWSHFQICKTRESFKKHKTILLFIV